MKWVEKVSGWIFSPLQQKVCHLEMASDKRVPYGYGYASSLATDARQLALIRKLHPRFEGFLIGLIAASRFYFSVGGLYFYKIEYDGDLNTRGIPENPDSREKLQEYFACVLGNTTLSMSSDAKDTVDTLFEVIEECYPECKVYMRTHMRRGWPDQLEILVKTEKHDILLTLDWAVS